MISCPAVEAARFGDHAGGVDHRRDAALHVLRAAAVDAAVALVAGSNGAVMPATPTVSMWPQNISDRPGARPSSVADDVGAAGRDVLRLDASGRCRRIAAVSVARDGRFAGRAGHQRRVDRIDRDQILEEL